MLSSILKSNLYQGRPRILKDIAKMQLFVERHMYDGRALTVPCTIEVLSRKDEDISVKLHNEVAHGLSREIFAASTEEDLKRFMSKDGLAVGARYEDRLICLRTLKTSPEWVRESLKDYNLAPDRYANSAVTGFCVVDKEFRGNNIQFLSQFYAENIVSKKYDSVVTTVSPKNIFSLQNVLACGYYIIAIEWTYGGFLRFVLKKEFYPAFPLWTHGHLRIPIREIKKQQEAISRGNAGYKIVRGPRGFIMLYGRVGP